MLAIIEKVCFRRKKKCQFVIKTEDGYQMTVANSGNEDSEDHCSESEECLAAERAEMQQQIGAAFVGAGGVNLTPNTQSSVGGGLSPLQQHINTSSAAPSSTIPAATDMTIKNNPNSITSSNSSTNQIGDPCLSPSAADSTMAAHVAAAGALLAANQTLLPQSSLSRCAAGPGQRGAAAAHTQQNLAPFFAAVASSQHSGFHTLPSSAGNMVSSLPFSSSPHHQFSTAALFPHNIHSTATS